MPIPGCLTRCNFAILDPSRQVDTDQTSLAICLISHHQALSALAMESWSGAHASGTQQ